MPRFPAGAGYIGPTHCYDDMIHPDDLLRRIAYGLTPPMLPPKKRLDAAFWGRLLDETSNSHAVIVKALRGEDQARRVATELRRELPAERFEVGVVWAPERCEWLTIVYNRIPKEQWGHVKQLEYRGVQWVDAIEVARVLRISARHARLVMNQSGVEVKRLGGRGVLHVRQQDLIHLANRPRAWKRRNRPL